MTRKKSQVPTKSGKNHSLNDLQTELMKSEKRLKKTESIDLTTLIGKTIAVGLDAVSTASSKTDRTAKKSKRHINLKNRIGWCQDVIPIDTLINGVIKTTDKRYIQILEILPVNFNDMTIYEKNNITTTYASLYKNSHVKTQLKMTSDRTNPSRIISYINEQTKDLTSEHQLIRKNDLINHIRSLALKASLSKRFFFIFEYEGEENGRKSKDEELILNTMYEYEAYIRNSFTMTNNSIVVADDRNKLTLEILYYMFNRKSSQLKPLEQRINELKTEQHELTVQGIKRDITITDIVAPDDLNLFRKQFGTIDHQYVTYLTIKDESYPSWAETGWMQLFSYADHMDTDVFTQKMSKEFVKTMLGQLTKFQDAANYMNIGKNAKEKANELLRSNLYIDKALKSDEDIFNLATVLTIRADTKKDLMFYKHQIIKGLTHFGISVADSYLNIEEYFQMTMPLLTIIPSIFLKNAHNFVTSSLGSMYLFTSFELFDPTGYVLGLNNDNQSLISINNFNTDWFRNGNMAILGTSGAGKTFTEMTIAQRMFFMGIRTHFIIPAKGYEYRPGCNAVDGSFIPLRPGSEACINIMDIYPETEINKEMLDEESKQELLNSAKVSSLAKQINFLITWIQLNMGNETLSSIQNDELDIILVNLYNDFGITEDDDSLYEDMDTKKLKRVPIIEDMYDRIAENSRLEDVASMLRKYVTGSCKNMNGQTNVNLNNRYTVYDIDESSIDPKMFPAFLYLGFKCVYSVAKSTNEIYDAIFLDEIWKLLGNRIAALQVKDMIKVIRGYAGCAVIATQDIGDFLSCEFGSALLGNTEIKLFLGLLEPELKKITEVVTISPEDQIKILGYQKGFGMLFAKHTKVTVKIEASSLEFDLFNTDPKARKRRMEEKAALG